MPKIKEFLEAFKAVLQLIIELWKIIKQYPGVFCTTLIIAVLYWCLHYFAFDYPGKSINKFYHSVEDHNYREAWNLLFPGFRKERWGDDSLSFRKGFLTTVSYSNVVVSYDDPSSWNPYSIFNAIFSSSIEYDVSFNVLDSFTRDNFKGSEQQDDLLWLQIKDRPKYTALKDSQLGNKVYPNPSLELIRCYKKKIEVKRIDNLHWVISHVKNIETGLTY